MLICLMQLCHDKRGKIKALKVKALSRYKDEVYLWILLIWVMVLNQYKLMVHH